MSDDFQNPQADILQRTTNDKVLFLVDEVKIVQQELFNLYNKMETLTRVLDSVLEEVAEK